MQRFFKEMMEVELIHTGFVRRGFKPMLAGAWILAVTLAFHSGAPASLNAQGFGPPLSPNQGQGQLQPLPQRLASNNPGNGFQSPNNAPPPLSNSPDPMRTGGLPSIPNGNAPVATGDATPSIANRNLLQMFHDGGWMMYPIALCSFILTVFIFERLFMLRGGRVIPRPFVRRLIEQLQQQQIDREEALELCEKNPSVFATILVAAVKKYGRSAVEVEQAVVDAGERVSGVLRKHLRILNSISNVAPLLGLLGTVLGMIEAFNAISTADTSVRASLLAGGIGHAMLTTAGGLMVAIPAYLSYMYFLGRTDKLLVEMDHYAQQVVEAISAEGLAENDTSRTRGRAKRAA